MDPTPTDDAVERFHPTSGRLTGGLGLALCALLLVTAWRQPDRGLGASLACAAVFGAAVVWSVMLRPRVSATSEHLVLRNPLHVIEVPLAAIERVVVTQVLAVWADGRRYVSPAIGQTRRQGARANLAPARGPEAAQSYPAFVESRITALAESARARSGLVPGSGATAEPGTGVRRTWAWPEVAALCVSALAFLVSLV